MENQLNVLVQTLEPQDMRLGHCGDRVRSLQLVLKNLALFDRETNGYFCAETTLGLRQFQKDIGLAAIGDFNDAATWYALLFWAKPICRAERSRRFSLSLSWVANVWQRFRNHPSVLAEK